jgi:hypothetical protein
MEELTKLVRIVTKRAYKNPPLLDLKHPAASLKEGELFLKIKEGECSTDAEASELMYPNAPDNSKMKMLKSRLRRKLFNHLFFLDYTDPKIKLSNRYEAESLNSLHYARILVKEGEHQISEKLIRTALKPAAEAEFTSIVISFLELLKTIYVQTGHINGFKKVQQKLLTYRKLLIAEQEAQDLYQLHKIELNKSVSSKKRLISVMPGVLSRLKELWEQTRSFNIFEHYYILSEIFLEMTGQFDKIIDLAAEAEKMERNKTLNMLRFDKRFNTYINVYAHLRVKSYDKGLQVAEKAEAAFDRSSNNWFAFMENYFLLAMHAARYELALKLINEVFGNPFIKKINTAARERWTLYRSYLYFVHPLPQLQKKFNFMEFITSVPEYSKDKQGFNVAILILQFLHYLRAGETDDLIYRIDNLKKYEEKHLKDSFSDRTRMMFRLLGLTVKEDMNYYECKKKGRYFYEKLHDMPSPGDAYAEIEIIPYEQLWEITLNILKHKQ